MLWVKSFHIIFVVSWFAGMLYLPRLFVYHTETHDDAGHERFVRMERKLLVLMTVAAVLSTIFGLWLLAILASFATQGWMHAKLALYLVLVAYHVYCWKIYTDFKHKKNVRSHVWFRWFNEMPAILLIAIVILVEVKPF